MCKYVYVFFKDPSSQPTGPRTQSSKSPSGLGTSTAVSTPSSTHAPARSLRKPFWACWEFTVCAVAPDPGIHCARVMLPATHSHTWPHWAQRAAASLHISACRPLWSFPVRPHLPQLGGWESALGSVLGQKQQGCAVRTCWGHVVVLVTTHHRHSLLHAILYLLLRFISFLYVKMVKQCDPQRQNTDSVKHVCRVSECD